ncbi:MAG: nucleoside hydrolase [Pirellulaceae bacterium]
MKTPPSASCLPLWLTLCATLCIPIVGWADSPAKVVFDTDIAGDVDDALALAMLHALADRGECTIEAVTVSKTHPQNGPMVDAINTFYGRPGVRIGVTKGNYPRDSKYVQLADTKDNDAFRYPHDMLKSSDAPDAVTVLRQVLAGAEPHSISIVSVGLAVNIADLLESPADEISPLPGVDLVRQKVKRLSIMAGAFQAVNGNQHFLEANVRNHIGSMQRFVQHWPNEIPVVWSDFTIGIRAPYPRKSIARDFGYTPHHIIRESYLLYCGPDHDRPSWDLTSVLYAVRPNDGYFALSPTGLVSVADDGFTEFTDSETGCHRYLKMNPIQTARVIEVQRTLVSQPPVKSIAHHLPNVVRVHPKVLSGGLPEGDAAFAELVSLGVKTIISVDGAKPDVQTARAHGLRYVHLPHGYDGIPEQRVVELAKAVRDLEGAIYIHCHHGKHRSPAAASVACVASGLIPSSRGVAILQTAGTSPGYRGLYRAARDTRAIDASVLDSLELDFPEVAEIPPMAETMVNLEQSMQRIKKIADAGWNAPANHLDLEPVYESLLLREQFTELLRSNDSNGYEHDFENWLNQSEQDSRRLHRTLRQWNRKTHPVPPQTLTNSLQNISNNCHACHQQYRDNVER